VVYQKVANPGR